MNDPKPTLPWTTVPERRFSDVVSPTTNRDAGEIREALRIGLNSLSTGLPSALVFPSALSAPVTRIAGRKDLHCHRFLEVGIVMRGEMTIWWEGETTRLPAGSVFVVPPGIRYLPHFCEPGMAPATHSVVWLALHRGCAVAHRCNLEGKHHRLGEYYAFTDAQLYGQTKSLTQELADHSPFFEQAARGCLLCLFAWLLRAPVHSVAGQDGAVIEENHAVQNAFQESVENYLLSHYHRPLSLSQVARSLGCSPAYLCRQFRKQSGRTPFQYLRSVRMDAARRLLLSEVPIGRVAEMVGFDDPLYFSRVFAAQFGISPQNFRSREKSGVDQVQYSP